jgi:hypothetical protein
MSSSVIIPNEKSQDDIQQKLRRRKILFEKNRMNSFLDPLTQQRILHRRIQSDPLLSIPKDSTTLNGSSVISPSPIPFYDEMKIKQQGTIPSISYTQSDECSSYSSSYDSRGDLFDQNKQIKLTLEQSTNSENNNRQSISSQITLIDEQDNNSYHHRLSPIINNDDTILSINSTSPIDQSMTMSTTENHTRSMLL